MSEDRNPYESPSTEPVVSLLWDRSVLMQVGFGIQTLVLVAYCFIILDSDRSPSSMLAGADPWFHIAMAVASAVGFALVFAMAITNSAWPLHQRICLIGIDLALVGVLAYTSQGFGTLL